MTSPDNEHSPPPPAGQQPPAPPRAAKPPAAQALPAAAKPHAPVKRVGAPGPVKKKSAAPNDGRRDFFSDAMREALGPFTGIIERKLHPILSALEAIPYEA